MDFDKAEFPTEIDRPMRYKKESLFGMALNTVSVELIRFGVYFSCLLTRKDTKRNSRKKPFPAERVPYVSSQRAGAFSLLEAKMRGPISVTLKPPPTHALRAHGGASPHLPFPRFCLSGSCFF